jgi:hypothetical protein
VESTTGGGVIAGAGAGAGSRGGGAHAATVVAAATKMSENDARPERRNGETVQRVGDDVMS